MPERQLAYYPQIFEASNEAQAREIILTPERGTTSEERWGKETEFLKSDIAEFLSPTDKTLILDYGCGIGRMAKVLIETTGCMVIGVDISVSMRQLAPRYVASDRFTIASKTEFEAMVANGLRADAGIALWVLQHCLRVREDVQLIKSALRPGGLLYVLNNLIAAVPTNAGWVNDGTDIVPILDAEFDVIDVSRLPTTCTTIMLSDRSFIARLRNGQATEA